ncbi:MAG: transposase [Thermomonas sp.]|nr:transposase [Thermomonas sp.]MDI1253478.1 transposase [Thermomonas sp.]
MVTCGRLPLFAWESASRHVISKIRLSDVEGSSRTHAWVVMPNHVHWLFTLGTSDLSTCVRRFKSRSARAFNSARLKVGPVWQAGFFDHRLRGEDDLRAQARYIIANPVRAGLVETICDYPFWWCQWLSRDDFECDIGAL